MHQDARLGVRIDGVGMPWGPSTRSGVPRASDDQVRSLAHVAKHPQIVLLLAYTGIRWGELAGLRVRRLDLLRRRISLMDNALTVGRRIVVGPLKGHRNRTVCMPGFVAQTLAPLCWGKGRDELL